MIRSDMPLYIACLALLLAAPLSAYAMSGPELVPDTASAPVVTPAVSEISLEACEAPDEAQQIEAATTQDMVHLGTYTVTAYSADYACTGKRPGHPAYGITASGIRAAEGRTVAADWDVLPAGTVIYISGIGERVVEDRGGAIDGQDLDLYFEDYDTALAWGVQKLEVYLIP